MIQVIRHEDGSETRSRSVNAVTGETSWPVTSREASYLVLNAESKSAAFAAILDEAPLEEDGLIRRSVRFENFTGDGAMELTVVYEEPDEADDGTISSDEESEPELSFDCSSGTKHIVRSLNQKKLYPSPDPGGMIGWNGKTGSDADFSGVDVGTATMRETYTKQMRSTDLTTAYKRTIANLTNTVNSTSFMGWEAGEVLFLGASFSGSLSGEFITVTFNFAIQQNERNVEVAEGLRVNKRGWEYIWTITETVSEGENKAPHVKIINAIVDQVYRYEDFGKLKL